MAHTHPNPAWKHDGVCAVPANQLGANIAQTSGMDRKAAMNVTCGPKLDG